MVSSFLLPRVPMPEHLPHSTWSPFSKYSLRDTEQREHLKQEVCQCLLSRAVTYVPCVMTPLQSTHTRPTICAL